MHCFLVFRLAEQVDQIIYALEKIKARNPNALYLCDPVMPNAEKVCVVADGVRERLIEKAIPTCGHHDTKPFRASYTF